VATACAALCNNKNSEFFLTSFCYDSRNRQSLLSVRGALNGVWWSKNITRNRKKIIYNSMVKRLAPEFYI
jgi:hypothetical protein